MMAPTTSTFGGSRGILTKLGVALGILVALGIVTGVIKVPSLGDALANLSDALGAWTYLVIPLLAFTETAAFLGLVIPGETAVLLGGVIGERGEVSVPVLIVLVWIAAVAGDVVSLLLGRRLGRPFLERHGPRLGVKAEHIERVERLFEQHSGKTIVVGRFVGVLRPLVPFMAGTSGLSLRRFLPYSAAAGLVWATTFTLVGYVFSDSFAAAGDWLTRGTLAVAIVVVLAIWAKRSLRPSARPAEAGAASSTQRRPTPA